MHLTPVGAAYRLHNDNAPRHSVCTGIKSISVAKYAFSPAGFFLLWDKKSR
jgi:hypothetical protein